VLRSSAAAALRQIDRQWEKHESIKQILPKIKEALDHHDYWVKHSAVKLFEQLAIDPSTIGAESEAEQAPVGEPEHPAFSILADLLFDFDRDLRLAAAEALGRLREKSAKPILAAAVHDEDLFVQHAAQMALVTLS
jgi:HEAT repeat protein